MTKIILSLPDRIIEYSFYALFFLIPLILTPFNYELFEYNKMMLTYALTIIIIGTWIIKMVINRKAIINRTPLDLPILLFLLSQIISTIFSIDRHVSIWGYYSRFNGGLLSTVSYILLYFSFVSNFPKEKIKRLLLIIFSSAVLVSVYGILEHLGIDKDIWVQDVQNRVFSTLGQPNWLAAYLAVLIPIAVGLVINTLNLTMGDAREGSQTKMYRSLGYSSGRTRKLLLCFWVISIIFYLTLIFTKSRSGFLGFWLANGILWSILFFRFKQNIVRLFIIFNFSFLILNFIFGAPFPQINHFTLPALSKSTNQLQSQTPTKPTGGSIIEVGITESGTIRRIVWKGAIEVFRHFPLTGSGVETFAFAYYKYRPPEHNMTSEWDFLYNKAHNEYLNLAATTGILGLGSYLLIILFFIGWNIKNSIRYQVLSIKYKNKEDKNIPNTYYVILNTVLFASWLSILVTNFFGFSVVIIQIFFFLIPTVSFVLSEDLKPLYLYKSADNSVMNNYQKTLVGIFLFFIFYFLFFLSRLWYADVIFANGYRLSRSGEYAQAYQAFKQAIGLNKKEPLYYDELALPAAQLALAFYDEKNATVSSGLVEEAVNASTLALNISPNNVNFWKTRTRILFALSQFDDQYLNLAIQSLEFAKQLSPTDPKIHYNLALLYDKSGKSEESIAELVETTKLKPDFRDAYFALAIFYDKNKQKDKAKETLEFILTKIATNDAEAKRKLEDLK